MAMTQVKAIKPGVEADSGGGGVGALLGAIGAAAVTIAFPPAAAVTIPAIGAAAATAATTGMALGGLAGGIVDKSEAGKPASDASVRVSQEGASGNAFQRRSNQFGGGANDQDQIVKQAIAETQKLPEQVRSQVMPSFDEYYKRKGRA